MWLIFLAFMHLSLFKKNQHFFVRRNPVAYIMNLKLVMLKCFLPLVLTTVLQGNLINLNGNLP